MQATFTKERLMPYREKGYSNREIAKAVGCTYQTVLNKLGPQDEQLTILMQEQRQKNYRAMNLVRQEYCEKREREAKKKAEQEENERRLANAREVFLRYCNLNTELAHSYHEVAICEKKLKKKKESIQDLETLIQQHQEAIKLAQSTICDIEKEIETYNVRMGCACETIYKNESVLKNERTSIEDARLVYELNEIAWPRFRHAL